MSTQTRREREKEEIQRQVLDAARELFASEGYEAVTMRQIADRVEYTPTALYFHFKDKEDLFRRLCAEDFGKLAARFQVLARVPNPIERLRMLGRGYIAFALDHPNHYRLMFMGPGSPGPRAPIPLSGARTHPDARAPDRDLYVCLLQSATEAAESGMFRPEFVDPHLAAQTLWAGLHGVASLAIAKRGDPWADWRPIEARVDAMLNGLLNGLLR